MDQENPFLDASDKFDAAYTGAFQEVLAIYKSLGIGKNQNAATMNEDDGVGPLMQKAYLENTPELIMMVTILIYRAAEK